MAESSGFFPDVSGDREYTTDFLARWIASIIGNGVYDGELSVTADGSAMSVALPAGRAWINGYHYRNDGGLTLPIDNADGVLNRKDIIVLRWDVNARNITAQVLKGTPASTATAPSIVRTVEQYDLKIAEISVPAGTTAITQALITDTRLDNTVCGIVTGVVKQVDTTTLYNQIQSDLAGFKATNEAGFATWRDAQQSDYSTWSAAQRTAFDTWLNGIKDVLDADTAGHLLNLVNGKTDKTVPATAGNFAALNGDGTLADSGKKSGDFAAASHAATHHTGGSDPLAPGDIGCLMPRLTVTAPTGSSVTCSRGSTILTATESSGTWVFNLTDYGTWTVAATLNGETSSQSVVVDSVKQYSTALSYIDHTLNNNSWADIHSVSADGANYWSVGDRKAVTLSGTVGTQSISGTYYVFILGFNHNSSIEGNGIQFGGFKTALSGGSDICLVDSKYNNTSTDGGKYFNMNHSSNINTGGWQGCDLRYDVLGSVNSKGTQNAAATTATNPVSNTLMAALPSDLRSVMQPMTKYSDNTGGGNDTASYVSTTIDYLPLLAEFEIFGTRTCANSAEKNYQVQYAYFTNGNSKVKYKHNDTATSAYWWGRSVVSSGTYYFCCVSSSGVADYSNADSSFGISPAFKV